MKYCTEVTLASRESQISHIHLSVCEKAECDGSVIALMGKGFFAGFSESGFLSTWNASEAVVFRNSSDAQKVVNCGGLYHHPGIYSLRSGVELVEGWRRLRVGA